MTRPAWSYAELIAVGSELLQPGFRDTNSAWLSAQLAQLGIRVQRCTLVGDHADRIAASILRAWKDAPVVLVTGGLGPTEDDRTRAALARVFGTPLESDAEAVTTIAARLAARGRAVDADQLRQALRPAGTLMLPNPVGSAPGILVEGDEGVLAALPGVPAEMRAMFEASIAPRLRGRSGRHLSRRILKIAGRTESSVDRAVRDLYTADGLEATILAKSTGIELVLLQEGRTPEEAQHGIDEIDRAFVSRLGEDVFGRDEETLASVIGQALRTAAKTLATAESCTAGLLGATITEVAGSSAWYQGGFIVYSDGAKVTLAGVSEASLARAGAVSEEVALELAVGARERLGADFGLGVTGIAGPGGGSVEKPVGLVYVGVAGGRGARAVRHLLAGDRDLIRRRTVTLALDLLRRELGRPE